MSHVLSLSPRTKFCAIFLEFTVREIKGFAYLSVCISRQTGKVSREVASDWFPHTFMQSSELGRECLVNL